jgi:hypothetical protein
VVCVEGGEPDSFWELLGGKGTNGVMSCVAGMECGFVWSSKPLEEVCAHLYRLVVESICGRSALLLLPV